MTLVTFAKVTFSIKATLEVQGIRTLTRNTQGQYRVLEDQEPQEDLQRGTEKSWNEVGKGGQIDQHAVGAWR